MNEYCKENIEDVFIVLNDFNTLEWDIRVLELGEKQTSKLKYEPSSAYGQDGYTVVSEDAYEGFTRVSRLLVNNVNQYEVLMDIIYIGLEVRVYYSDDKGKYRLGTISNIVDDVIIGDNREITIEIDLQPFQYGEDNITILTKKETLINIGNIYNTPIIKVYGTGIGNIYIGSQILTLNVDEFLYIDNEVMDIFDKNGLRANSRRLAGSFPLRLKSGSNVIRFDGLITKLEIMTNWRWR